MVGKDLRAGIFFVALMVMSQLALSDDCCGKVASHTYFNVRSQFLAGSPEYRTAARQAERQSDKGFGYFSITPFGGQSTNTKDVARFFSPFCCPTISVDGTIEEGGKSLLPQHFNLFSVKYTDEAATFLPNCMSNIDEAFASTISLKPRQSVFGVGFMFAGKTTCRHDYTWHFAVSAPLEYVRNTMGLCEKNIREGEFFEPTALAGEGTNLDTQLRTMTQALNQEGWCYGKIGCKARSKFRLAFVQLKAGVEWLSDTSCTAISYWGLTIPTGNKPRAKNVFAPIVGNGGHVGIFSEHILAAKIYDMKDGDYGLHFETDVVLNYLFAKTQTRSMDLKGKPWSRYMELYCNKDQAVQANELDLVFLATPGINVLTQKVKVKPGFSMSSNMALFVQPMDDKEGYQAELGYNVYAREAECAELDCSKLGTAAIKDHLGIGLVNPVRDMTNDLLLNEASIANVVLHGKTNDEILADYETRLLTIGDLDVNSAAHPAVISHTVYGSFGYSWNKQDTQVMAHLGGSYEFSGRMNSSLDRWLVWTSMGINF